MPSAGFGLRRKSGTYTGDGSLGQNINTGFRPQKVEVFNITDGDVYAFSFDGMADAKGVKIKDSGAGTTDVTFMASAGISFGQTGFQIGTDADLIENAKVYRWFAWG